MIEERLFGIEQTQTTSDDYYTPRWIFDRLGLTFDLDVAAPPGGIPWIPARRYFTLFDDGVAQPWEGLVWMNPPFSNLEAFVRRFMAHDNGIALLPAVRSQWFTNIYNSHATMCWLKETMKFVTPSGQTKHIWPPTALWALGETAQSALRNVGPTRTLESIQP
jgi:hypothetical protein